MSDCSSAMMPKELRMCKTCGHENVCRYRTSLLVNCNNWIESSERYEHLAQVARSMYRVIAMFETRFEAEHYSPSEWAPERGAITKSTKEQLEALGVSVDE